MPWSCASARPSGQASFAGARGPAPGLAARPAGGLNVAGAEAGEAKEDEDHSAGSGLLHEAHGARRARRGHMASTSPAPRSCATKFMAGCDQPALDGSWVSLKNGCCAADGATASPARGAASASSMAWRTAWCTSRPSRKRTSILVGCTFTSTRAGSISRYSA
jgi:hypothetical protein